MKFNHSKFVVHRILLTFRDTFITLPAHPSHHCNSESSRMMYRRPIFSMLVLILLSSTASAGSLYEKKATWPETMAAAQATYNQMVVDGQIKNSGVTLGPWYSAGWMKTADIDAPGFPEENLAGGIDLGAKRDDGQAAWTVMLQFVDGQIHKLDGNDGGSSYLYREIDSPIDQELSVGFGSDDGLKVWLNGELLLRVDTTRSVNTNQNQVTLSLKKGKNTLLLKVYNSAGNHAFFFGSEKTVDPMVVDFWNQVARDFPIQTQQIKKTLGESHTDWFRYDRNSDNEKNLTQVILNTLGTEANPFRTELDRLVTANVPATDPAWLALCEKVAFVKDATTKLSQISLDSVRMAVNDLKTTFEDEYPDGQKYLDKIDALVAQQAVLTPQAIAGDLSAREAVDQFATDVAQLRREALLANPLMSDFDEILIRRAKDGGLMQNWISNCSRHKGQYENDIVKFSPKSSDAKLTTVLAPKNGSFLGDVCLHWDAKKMLVTALDDETGEWQIFEVNVDGSNMTRLTSDMGENVNNAEACYTPDGGIIFSSSATMLGVPCIAGSDVVANLYRLEPDRKTVRQLTFEQDQNWCPTILPNGRVMYLRWEYTDTSHYFTRLLMSMNPDGTGQMEYYGSNSFWPNSLFFAKTVPDSSTKFVGIVSGHHGVARIGELILFDTAKGRRETDGVVQRIPGYGKEVEPVIKDELVANSWPKFLHPYPLSDKYFLVSAQLTPESNRGIYLVDVFDNMILLKEEPGYGLYEPVPLVERETPPVIAPRIDLNDKEAVVYLTDVHIGDGLKGVPRGTVKKLRLFTYTYSYRNLGGHDCFGMESSWDSKKIIGEVPVYEDGSAMFKIPANTPIALQPLDEKGSSLQLMRSWLVGMPGERVSCVGCHEPQNTTPPSKTTIAGSRSPAEIEPWFGPARTFSFLHEVQPVLDKYCAGCHDGSEEGRPNLADTTPSHRGFAQSYHAIHGYVRRPGPESDYHMLRPLEYHSSTSELIQMLKRGHHNVQLDPEAWARLNMWIDMNAPCYGTWSETNQARGNMANLEKFAELYSENREKFACVCCDHPEEDVKRPLPPKPEFIKPEKLPEIDPAAPAIDNWPFSPEQAKAMQTAQPETVTVGDGVSFEMVQIPAGQFTMGDAEGYRDQFPRRPVTIEKPFWMMTTEVTNALFKQFDAEHDSRYIDQWNKDHTRPGYVANAPNQPVIRVTWQEANAFCKWLSEKTGRKFRLPTEAEWEWASRAGSETPFWFGNVDADFGKFANLADHSLHLFVVAGIDPQPIPHQPYEAFIPMIDNVNDGQMIPGDVGQYAPNPWGLKDMHGSVAEWTASDDRPYPYVATDGRNDGNLETEKIIRGGSWRDRPKRATSGFRMAYPTWQKVYNVGFRVIAE